MTTLRAQGVAFRNDIVEDRAARQILCEDPSGNVVELFEAAARRPVTPVAQVAGSAGTLHVIADQQIVR